MGCTLSKQHFPEHNKFKEEVEGDLKGSTALAFFNKEGIIVAVESRASNEWDEHDKPLQIRDNKTKMRRISPTIISVFVGKREDCRELSKHMRKKFPYSLDEEEDESTGDQPRVKDVAEAVHKYLMSLRGKNKGFGLLLAGWDAERGSQIYRLFIADGRVVKQKVSASFAVLGSGQFYAATSLKKRGRCYNYNMSADDAVELAREALFDATFYDRFSGGPLRVYVVSRFGLRTEPVKDPFEAYSKYYHLYEQKKTLFLVVISSQYIPPIVAGELVQHFWQNDITVLAAHCVAHRVLGQQRLSFHRLVLKRPVDAENAYALTSPHYRTHTDILSMFPNQLFLTTVEPSVELYLNWSSEGLLQFLSRKFDGYLPETVEPFDL